MGLDTVELVMAVEEWFEISIPDAAAQTLFTVGDLHRFVVSELTHRSV
jgi:acyl carrier protein